MDFTKLGNTELTVSRLALGTMTFGEQTSLEEGHLQIDYALANGINFMDTAEMYSVPGRKETQGSTERIIGEWFKKNPGQRTNWVLATKITGPSTLFTYISEDLRFSEARLNSALEGSLKRLQTDYIDLYQLHWPERKTNSFGTLGYTSHDRDWEDNFENVISVLNSFVKQGKIRYWGLSNETPWGLMRCREICARNNWHGPVSIQNPYNLLNRTFEIGLAEMAIREKISLLAYSPLAFGLLTGKYHRHEDLPTDRINQFSRLSRYNGDRTRRAAGEYLKLAEENDLSLAHIALSFVKSMPFVTSVIIGARTLEQLKENIREAQKDLPDQVREKVELIHASNPNPAP